MTIITQYLLKCDYCGLISPPTTHTDVNEHGTPQVRALLMPPGWIEIQEKELAEMYKPYDMILRDRGTNKDTLVPGPTMSIGITLYHFCRVEHRDAWQAWEDSRGEGGDL